MTSHNCAVPLYDFRCTDCGTEFEAFASVSGTASCPECASMEVERVLTGFAGPFTLRKRGPEAARSNSARAAREEARRERREARKRQGS